MVEGIVNPRDDEAVEHRDQRDDDLRDEFVASTHLHDVVPQASTENKHTAEEQADEPMDFVELIGDRRNLLVCAEMHDRGIERVWRAHCEAEYRKKRNCEAEED